MKSIITRSISGLIYGLIVFLFTTNQLSDIFFVFFNIKISSFYLFYALNTLFIIGCLIEIIKMLDYSNIIYKILTAILAGILYYTFSQDYFNHNISFIIFSWKYVFILILFILAIITLFRFPEELTTDKGKLIFVVIYIGIPFCLSLSIPMETEPLTPEIFYIFLLIWISDTFAYFIGSKFGKRKLAPKISPNKSLEGFIGGIFFTIITGSIIQYYCPDLKGNWIIIGIIISIFAPIGDLVESKLKRNFDVKDSGKLMPGHGGILDRLDSYIFCIPVIFAYYLLKNTLFL